jgi:hypothetical protein
MVNEPPAPELEPGEPAQALMDRGARIGKMARRYIPGRDGASPKRTHARSAPDDDSTRKGMMSTERQYSTGTTLARLYRRT